MNPLQNNNVTSVEEKVHLPKKPSDLIRENTIFYKIKSKDEIHSLLNKLFKTHALLSISVGESSLVYGSVILEINTKDSYLVLDELYPRNQINNSLLNQKVSIETQVDGILLRFSGNVDSVSEQDGNEYYKIKVPNFLYYHQRRTDYRVPISITKPLPADLSTQDDVRIHAELRDISMGGFSARLTSPSAESLAIGDEIPTCVIQMPDGKRIVCGLEVIRINDSQPRQNTRIGARFINLSNTDSQQLSKALALLERQNIKTIKRQADN